MSIPNPYAPHPNGHWQPHPQQQPYQPYPQQHPQQLYQTYQPHPQQYFQPPHMHSNKSQNGLIIGIVLAITVIIALFGVLFVSLTGSSNTTVANPKKVEAAFAGGTLRSCDLGLSFFTDAGWKDVTNAGDEGCFGYYDIEEGEIKQSILIVNQDQNIIMMEPAPEGITGWKQSIDYTPEDARCVMESDTPELSDVHLIVKATCETLYPMAVQLNNLVAQYRNGKGDLTYMDPAPKKQPIAGGAYAQMIGDAAPVGTKQEIDPFGTEGATLTIDDVRMTRGQKLLTALCVDATFNPGKFTDSSNSFELPNLFIIKPSGETQFIPHTRQYKQFREYEDIHLSQCIDFPNMYRYADMLIGATTSKNEKGTFSKAWAFRVEGADGDRVALQSPPNPRREAGCPSRLCEHS